MSRRDDVLHAALELLDEVGLDDLTVRRLAERLGVTPGAMYRHFASKQALLDAMVEALAGPPPGDRSDPPPGWEPALRALATGARAAMLSHRDGARLVATHGTPGPAAIAMFERYVGLLHGAGLSTEDATRAVDTVVCFVNGFTIEEQTRRPAAPTRHTRADRDQDFAAGLGLILAGIRAQLPADAVRAR
jgi:TetR/AcrR family transcriptional regulator, tetracycline repressor protein